MYKIRWIVQRSILRYVTVEVYFHFYNLGLTIKVNQWQSVVSTILGVTCVTIQSEHVNGLIIKMLQRCWSPTTIRIIREKNLQILKLKIDICHCLTFVALFFNWHIQSSSQVLLFCEVSSKFNHNDNCWQLTHQEAKKHCHANSESQVFHWSRPYCL